MLVILIVLYVGSQLALDAADVGDDGQTQRMIILALPFFFVAFIISSRPACSSTGSRPTCGRSCSRRSCEAVGPLRPPGAEAESLARHDGKLGAAATATTADGAAARAEGARTKADGEAAAGGTRAQGPAARAAAAAAAQEEEAVRAAPMSEPDSPEAAADRVRELLEEVVEALGLDAEIEVERGRRGHPRRSSRARTSAC